MLYMLVQTSEGATPESNRALNLLPACTVTVGQSDTSPTVQWFEKVPSPLFLITTGRGP